MPLPIIAPLIGAGIAAGASLLGGRDRNRMQREEAQKQRDFQERMSSSSYQRAVEDMKMAGINPMLAFQQGGASSPGGAQAQMQDIAGPAVSSAMNARRLTQELENMKATYERDMSTSFAQRQAGVLSARNTTLVDKNMEYIDAQIKDLQFSWPEKRVMSNFYGGTAGRTVRLTDAIRQSLFGGRSPIRMPTRMPRRR